MYQILSKIMKTSWKLQISTTHRIGLLMRIIWNRFFSFPGSLWSHMSDVKKIYFCLWLKPHLKKKKKQLYKLNVVQALKLIYVFKFSVSSLLLDSISFLCMSFSVNFLCMIFSIFMIDFKIPFGLSEFHQFNAPTQLNDQTFQTISLFFFDNKTKWDKSNIYQRSTDFA